MVINKRVDKGKVMTRSPADHRRVCINSEHNDRSVLFRPWISIPSSCTHQKEVSIHVGDEIIKSRGPKKKKNQ